MSTVFSANELAAIDRFVRSFNMLYGHESFQSTDTIRGIPMEDHALNTIAAHIHDNEGLFGAFRREVAWGINNGRRGVELRVATPMSGVCEKLGLPGGTTLMSIFPHHGATMAATNARQVREQWLRTRLFTVTARGIYIIPNLDVDALVPPAA